MLNHHDQIAVPFETKIIENFHDKGELYGSLDEEMNQRRLVTDILNLPTMRDVYPPINVSQVMAAISGSRLADVFDAVLKAWARQQGKNRWGEKTVSNSLYFDTIIQWFPNARFIHPIRDGRDVAASLQKAPFGPKTPFTAARRWRQFVEMGLQIGDRLPADQYLSVHYEDLLDQPQRELMRICDFLGEEYQESMLRFSENTAPYPTDPTNNSNLKKGLLVSNKQKWRQSMGSREIAIVEAVAGPCLSKCGYERTVDDRRIGTMEAFYRRYMEPIPYKSISMMRNRRGHAEGVARLKLGLRGWWARLVQS